MDDTLLMRVLNCVADLDEKLQPLCGVEVVLVAVIGDANAANQFHYEVWTTVLGCAGVEHFGDVRMVHHRQRLTFRLEAGNDLSGIHTRFDDFERHATANRLLLFGHIDNPASALADFLAQFVMADSCAGLFFGRQRYSDRAARVAFLWCRLCCVAGNAQRHGAFFEELVGVRFRRQQYFETTTQFRISRARSVEERLALDRIGQLPGGIE